MCQAIEFEQSPIVHATAIIDENDYGTCEHCEEPLTAEYITTADNSVFCDAECAENADYAKCHECGEWLNENERREDPERNPVCESCFERASYSTCDECGNTIHDNEATWIEGEERILCEHCRRGSYHPCEDCGKWFHNDDMRYVDSDDYHVCDRCYERHDYFCCESCDRTYPYSCYGGDGYCDECYDSNNDNRIHDYSYRPSYKFFRSDEKDAQTNNLYLGIELEVEIERGRLSDACEEVEYLSHLYMKQDGSIDHGFEIVSHPCTLNYWQDGKGEFDRLLMELNKMGEAESQGLHVHISKSGMTDAHKIRFQSFFDANNALLPTIARRDECHWAKYKELSHGRWKDAVNNRDRYRAVNWIPEKTVEIRMFRGTLRISEFLASVEFCHAAYRFTKDQVSLATIANGDSWSAFCAFLKFDKRYSHLVKFLKNKEIYKG